MPLSTPAVLAVPSRPRFGPALARTLALAGAALLAACGGGDADNAGSSASSTPTTTAASAYTEGTVSGFGSIIVNGVRFDDSGITATDDSGLPGVVKLGMRVEVHSSHVDTSAGTARASAVHFGSRVVGPVSAIDTAAATVTVLGQVVDIGEATVFDSTLPNGLADITVGAVLEVHGLADSATGHLLATRVELESSVSTYKLRGTVSGLDALAMTFNIGGATVNYASATGVPTTLADGTAVRVLLSTTANSAGQWVVQSFGTAKGASTSTSSTPQQAHVRGTITAYTSGASFSVDGLAVDASAITVPTGLALGVEVKVEGTLTNGVLVATEVELKAEHRGHDRERFALHGAVTALDTTAKTFVLRGVTVDYSASTLTWTGGTAADLAVGKSLKVTGAVGATRSQITAASITFKN